MGYKLADLTQQPEQASLKTRSPRLTRISLCCCAASASWKHGGKRRKQMGYKLADLTQQPEQASLKTTSATERI